MTQIPHELDNYFRHVPLAEDVNKNDVNCIREWIQTQPHLPFVSDRQISLFLHSCYGAIELTKVTIENYYTQRTEMSDIFSGRGVAELKAYLHIIYMCRSAGLSTDNHQVMYVGFLDRDSSKFDCLMNAKLMFALLDILTNLNPYASGWRLCIDVKGLSFGHYVKLTTSLGISRKVICYLQTALPIRLKGIHVWNANSLICQFVNILKPFMKKELIDLIHLYPSSDDTLYEYIPKEFMPHQDYDNLMESSEKLLPESLSLLDTYKQWFEDDEKFARVDESKRAQTTHAMTKRQSSFFRSLLGRASE